MIVYVAVNIVAWAYILGTITLLVTRSDEAIGRYRDRMQALSEYCAANNLPKVCVGFLGVVVFFWRRTFSELFFVRCCVLLFVACVCGVVRRCSPTCTVKTKQDAPLCLHSTNTREPHPRADTLTTTTTTTHNHTHTHTHIQALKHSMQSLLRLHMSMSAEKSDEQVLTLKP